MLTLWIRCDHQTHFWSHRSRIFWSIQSLWECVSWMHFLVLCLLCFVFVMSSEPLNLTIRLHSVTTPLEWNPSGVLSATNFSVFPDLEGSLLVANYNSCLDKTFQYIFITSQSKPFKAFAIWWLSLLKEMEYPLIQSQAWHSHRFVKFTPLLCSAIKYSL